MKLAVLFIHGVEVDDPGLYDTATRLLREQFVEHTGARAEDALAIETVNWAACLEGAEQRLLAANYPERMDGYWRRLHEGIHAVNQGHESALLPLAFHLMRPAAGGPGTPHYPGLRWLLVNFIGDAIAYQLNPADRDVYTSIHQKVAEALGRLRAKAGDTAPLCVIAHSLGSVIASNYFYDLQQQRLGRDLIEDSVRQAQGPSPLERGETLSRLFTLGNPMALWSLRYAHAALDRPLTVPDTALATHHPGLGGEWVNFHDADDILAWPLAPLSDAYRAQVKDVSVRVGGPLVSWTPLVHPFYWSDAGVMGPIGQSLAHAWARLRRASEKAA
ncbi:hypothetical protein DRW03_17875 [Corallococcus sp. H22C18031201]|uniref:hypothetical protein n=1 Tax=Citreicoccus inhibens TaxID=2849499 RepID=UPI000E743590|nr:hypothetical protein [Citreicoccus inhibens]MBU8898426.1 hypothetical protein [Citreicoccus inhibens]RJS21277.1 hypothetical protein DRW03_17875 [Corallococcus sp. H22C18031201]